MEPINQTLADFVENLVGQYNPVTYIDSSGTSVIASGLAGVDYSYIFRIALFLLVVYSIFKVIGGIVCKNF